MKDDVRCCEEGESRIVGMRRQKTKRQSGKHTVGQNKECIVLSAVIRDTTIVGANDYDLSEDRS